MRMDIKTELAQCATEVVRTYPGWNCEHVHEYFICDPEPQRYTEDDLYTACQFAETVKDLGYDECREATLKYLETITLL